MSSMLLEVYKCVQLRIDALWYVGVFCRGGWTDVGELGGEWAGESEED